MRRYPLLLVLALALVANLLLLGPLPMLVQALAALLLAGLLPGLLLIEWLVGASAAPLPRWERTLYAIGVGYAILVMGTLLVSYLPGPLTRLHTIAAFDGLLLLLAALVAWSSRRMAPTPPLAAPSRWLLAGLLSLGLVGGFFRLANLGYSEFQGDEARAALRAAAIIQGYEDVLLLHKKGPTEIVIPTALYSLTGHLNEQTARLPFALANLAALFAIYLLGTRLFGPVAGWSAAMLLALDGYFIGFAHIVQYQSVVFLTSLLVVLVLHRLTRFPDAPARYLTLAAIFLATGLLSHYEAVFAAIPAAYLLWLWGAKVVRGGRDSTPRQSPRTLATQVLRPLVAPLLVGGAMLASFYVPFILHPNFSATYTYLTDRRIGGSFPYNNLADFFIRTSLYSTTYYLVLMIALATAALLWAYWRSLGRTGGILGALAAVGLLLTAFQPGWLTVGETDLVVLLFGVALAGLWLLPRLPAEERMLWLWFGLPMLIAFFFTEKPRTHVYVFFMPWALLVGMVIHEGGRWLRGRLGYQPTLLGGVGFASVAVVLFGSYAYWYFIHNRVEILRTWDQNRPAGYWALYEEPDDKALFGFPVANGWKVVGSLYQQGTLSGPFETNEKEAWVPAWYTRGAPRCARKADWYFQIDNLEPFDLNDQLAMEHYLRQGFKEWGRVEINGAPRLIIHQRTDEPLTPRLIPLSEWEATYDRNAAPTLLLDYPAVAPPEIRYPMHVNLGNQIWLEGYDIQYDAPLNPGDTFHLTLYWRAQQPVMASYKIFNQVYFGDSGMQAQLDGYPVCEGRETWRWDPGELITDSYEIQVKEDATPGLYPLYSGMYLEETGERLPILDEAGNEVGSQIHVTDIRIGEE